MLKAIRDLFTTKRRKEGVFLSCSCGPVEKRIGDADGLERYIARPAGLTEMKCWSCAKLARGCWGPKMEVRG